MKNKKVNYLKISKKAIEQLNNKITDKKDKNILGIKLAIKTKGCSGMAYDISYATKKNITKYDEFLDNKEISLFIDPKISLFLFGTEMDFLEKKTETGMILESGFVFNNPNETGRCGCGESFYV